MGATQPTDPPDSLVPVSVRRVMGIETEYGITVPGHPHVNAMVLSTHVVNAYAAAAG